MTILVALFAVAALSSAPEAKTLPIQWNASISTVLEAYPQSTSLANGASHVLEAKQVEFDGVIWKRARFKFDRTGHVIGLQLVVDGNVRSAVKAELANTASPLWDPMEDEVTQTSQASSSGSVTLCNDGEETTLTYARPPRNQPLLLTASNDLDPDSPTG